MRSKPPAVELFSPQAWGCTRFQRRVHVPGYVFPTGVGMYRGLSFDDSTRRSFPHRRGDVPQASTVDIDGVGFSPQAWGCTEYRKMKAVLNRVFPTGVGMYRG